MEIVNVFIYCNGNEGIKKGVNQIRISVKLGLFKNIDK